MVHGTEDYTLPYVNAKALAQAAETAGILTKFIGIQGAGHVPFQQLFDSHLEEFMGFVVKSMDLEGAQCPHAAMSGHSVEQ